MFQSWCYSILWPMVTFYPPQTEPDWWYEFTWRLRTTSVEKPKQWHYKAPLPFYTLSLLWKIASSAAFILEGKTRECNLLKVRRICDKSVVLLSIHHALIRILSEDVVTKIHNGLGVMGLGRDIGLGNTVNRPVDLGALLGRYEKHRRLSPSPMRVCIRANSI